MKKPLVTIIIPVYNTKEYVAACLESVMAQTYEEIEILIINDGSTDGSGELLQQYAKKDDRIRIFYQEENKGVSRARNLALAHACGEWICFVDSDDRLAPNAVEILAETMEIPHTDLAVCGYHIQYPDVLWKQCFPEARWGKEEAFSGILAADGICGYLWNKCFKREIIEREGVRFDESIRVWEDVLFVMEYVSHCEGIQIRPECLYEYWIRDNSAASYLWYDSRLLTQITAMEQIENILGDRKGLQKQLKVRWICCCLGILRSMALSKKRDSQAEQCCKGYIRMFAGETWKSLSNTDKISTILCLIHIGTFQRIYRWLHRGECL